MYIGLLHLHNVLRWLILIVALVVLFKYFTGWFGRKKWQRSDQIIGMVFTSLIDLQFLTGIILYFVVSPITKTAFQNFGAAMKNADLRFYVLEHAIMMLIAVVLIHIGWSGAKKARNDRSRYGRILIFFGLALIIILASIPWTRVI